MMPLSAYRPRNIIRATKHFAPLFEIGFRISYRPPCDGCGKRGIFVRGLERWCPRCYRGALWVETKEQLPGFWGPKVDRGGNLVQEDKRILTR